MAERALGTIQGLDEGGAELAATSPDIRGAGLDAGAQQRVERLRLRTYSFADHTALQG